MQGCQDWTEFCPSFNKADLMVTDDLEIPDEGGRIMLASVKG
jgi:hypothetical protein